jgi:hypothetical protein
VLKAAVSAKKLIACLVTNRDRAIGIRERVREDIPFDGGAMVSSDAGTSSTIGGKGARVIKGTPPGVLFRVFRRCTNGVVLMLRFAVGLCEFIMAGALVMRGIVLIGDASITLCWSTITLCSSDNVGNVGGRTGGGVRMSPI